MRLDEVEFISQGYSFHGNWGGLIFESRTVRTVLSWCVDCAPRVALEGLDSQPTIEQLDSGVSIQSIEPQLKSVQPEEGGGAA